MFMNIWMSLSCTGGLPLDSPRFIKGIRVSPTSYVRIHLGFQRGIRVNLITHRGIHLGFHVRVGAEPVNGNVGRQEHNQEIQNDQHLHEVNDHLGQKGRENKKKAEPSASHINANSPCREEEANTFSGRYCISNGEKVTEENIANECPSERGLEGKPEHAPPEPKSDCEKLTCSNTHVAPVDQTEAKGEIQKEDLQHSSSEPPEQPVIALNIDGEENSEGENDKFIISNYWVRSRSRETHYTYPAIPQRRKKVPWTAKEEEMLKKGVRKFASVDNRTIPWKKILEFGNSVFMIGRTTIDLKDKWRNMSPRSK